MSETKPISSAKVQPATAEPIHFVEAELASRCVNNRGLMKRVLQSFTESFVQDLDQLQRLVNELDSVNARKVAHRMRGASGNVAAKELFRICSRMEDSAANSDLKEVADMIAQLTAEWSLFQDHILSITKG